MTIKIIYSDISIIAVNKPAGIPVHPDSHHKTGTLIQEVLKKFPEIKKVGDYLTEASSESQPNSSGQASPRFGLVHRLDKDTSGVLIIARDQRTFEFLKEQFKKRNVEKTYLVLVVGAIKIKKGVIDLPIGRAVGDPVRRISRGKMRGKIKEAVTEYRVSEELGEFTLLYAFPKTGRTHQIRSHFAGFGHPVVCDRLYSGKRYICPFGLTRHFLHAYALEFEHPDGGRMRLEAELPNDLNEALGGLRKFKKNDKK